MPILDIQLIGPVPEDVRSGLAQRIADRAASVFGSGPQETWVNLHFVPSDQYSENDGGPPAGTQPVIVSVLQASAPLGQARADQVAHLTRAIADACQRRPENVHLAYEPDGKDRLAFGGHIVG